MTSDCYQENEGHPAVPNCTAATVLTRCKRNSSEDPAIDAGNEPAPRTIDRKFVAKVVTSASNNEFFGHHANCGHFVGGTMPSKAYQRFDDRINALGSGLELADLLLNKFRRTANSEQTICAELGGSADRYPHLSSRSNTKQSRFIVAGHLKHTIYIAFIKELYEDFSEYLSTALSRAALAGVDEARFAGEVKLDLHAAEILKTGSWEGVVRLISDKIFRALENERSTITLIQKLSSRVGLQLEPDVMAAAMPYLDARHMLVHRDGKPDDIYLNAYPNVTIVNARIEMSFDFVAEARRQVTALATHIDARMQDAGLVRQQDMMGQKAAAVTA